MIDLYVHFKDSNVSKGTRAELKVAQYIRKQGYTVRHLKRGGSDLVATHKATGKVIRLEVKYSSRNLDGKYRATTYKLDKYGKTDHRQSDYIVFVCQNILDGGRCTSFVIPTNIQSDKTFLCVTSNPVTYSGKLSPYREAWGSIAS
jgi:hypothetical protein